MTWPRVHTPPLSVAPMMGRTDRHFRWLLRQITGHTLLYTEMITTAALLHGPTDRLLSYDPIEHPLALQLGGDDPAEMRRCARIAEEFGYDEININVGCPSDRVQRGCFGAALMKRPQRVAELVAAIRAAVSIPVTVKHRVGVDDLDSFDDLLHFVDVVSTAQPDRFTVHARKAWLAGLSPKENRSVPPLRHDDVWRLKAQRPALPIELNGGIRTLAEVQHHLQTVDAVMLGRAAYEDPWILREADASIFQQAAGDRAENLAENRRALLQRATRYADRQLAQGQRLGSIARHLLGIFSGRPGARAWRRHLSTHAFEEGAVATVITDALSAMDRAAEDVTARANAWALEKARP